MDSGDQDFVDVFVESDNTELGTKSAECLMEHIGGKGNIVEIINDAGAMIRTRKDAMHKVVEKHPDVKINQVLFMPGLTFSLMERQKWRPYCRLIPTPVIL